MKKVIVIYWSGTGNTEKMAELIVQGLNKSEQLQVVYKPVSEGTLEDIKTSDLVVLGCPAMGVEEIDDTEMAPFLQQTAEAFMNKPIALFGSYGWGDGEWMDTWEEMMKSYGANLAAERLIMLEAPEDDAKEVCVEYGSYLLKTI